MQFLVGREESKVAIICKGEAKLRCVLCGSWKAEPVSRAMRGPKVSLRPKGPYYVLSRSNTRAYTRVHQRRFTFVPGRIKREDADSHTCSCMWVKPRARRKLVRLFGSRNRRRGTDRFFFFFFPLSLFVLTLLHSSLVVSRFLRKPGGNVAPNSAEHVYRLSPFGERS